MKWTDEKKTTKALLKKDRERERDCNWNFKKQEVWGRYDFCNGLQNANHKRKKLINWTSLKLRTSFTKRRNQDSENHKLGEDNCNAFI